MTNYELKEFLIRLAEHEHGHHKTTNNDWHGECRMYPCKELHELVRSIQNGYLKCGLDPNT